MHADRISPRRAKLRTGPIRALDAGQDFSSLGSVVQMRRVFHRVMHFFFKHESRFIVEVETAFPLLSQSVDPCGVDGKKRRGPELAQSFDD